MDRTLVARGLADSREQAGRLIMAGSVRVDGVTADKRGRLVSSAAKIEVKGQASPFVSRGGLKLEAALEAFSLEPKGLTAMDVGASSGGFTDCLLQRGVRRVYAVDVGYGQLDWRLRQDPRVVVLERQNVRYLASRAVPEPIDLAVVDVSFISLTIVLPAVLRFLAPMAAVVTLVKPQFEVGRQQVGRGGIVRQDALRRAAAQKIAVCAEQLGLTLRGTIDSPIAGQKGNREILMGFERGVSGPTLARSGDEPARARPKGTEARHTGPVGK